MTPKEVLIAAKALIDTPDKWLRGKASADGAYCAWGAVIQVGTQLTMYDACELLASVVPQSRRRPDVNSTIWSYNDSHTHGAIMRLFDRAIEAANEP